jgi:hypothetical protein
VFKLLLAVILGSLIIATVGRTRQELDQSKKLLDRQVKGNLGAVMVVQAVINALIYADAPGGVVKVADCNQMETYSFRPLDSSLRGVLDSIVSADPRYTWEVKDAVINVIPRNELSPFLAVRISRFEILEVEPEQALSQMLAIPEVQHAQLSLGRHLVNRVRAYPFCPQGCPAKETKKISISLKDATVRETLNAIVRAHGSAVWWFQQWDCGGQKWFSLDLGAKE